CFSVYTSTKMIFNTKLSTEEITVVHGIRFLTMIWVIILHNIFFSLEYTDNKIQILRLDESLPIQMFSNATVSVDTYFFLSGFLLAYTYLKNKIDKEQINLINYKEKLNEFFVRIMKRYIRYFYVAVVILSTILISSVILSGYISYIYEYVPTLDEQYRLLDVFYFPPWIRIGPYIIGMITGYIIRRFNKKIVLKKNIVILCWTLGAACNILVLFGVYKTKISVLSAAIYVALSRTVWAIGIAWIVIMCYTEHGG
ncbi:NRF6 protein, partial [Acromyrmex charruanus]